MGLLIRSIRSSINTNRQLPRPNTQLLQWRASYPAIFNRLPNKSPWYDIILVLLSTAPTRQLAKSILHQLHMYVSHNSSTRTRSSFITLTHLGIPGLKRDFCNTTPSISLRLIFLIYYLYMLSMLTIYLNGC